MKHRPKAAQAWDGQAPMPKSKPIDAGEEEPRSGELQPTPQGQIQIHQHLGLQLPQYLTHRLDRHGEEFVNHQLGRLAQAIAPRGLHGYPHQGSLPEGDGERAEGDAWMGLKPAIWLDHHRGPWLSGVHPGAGHGHHRSAAQNGWCHAVQSFQSGSCSLQWGGLHPGEMFRLAACLGSVAVAGLIVADGLADAGDARVAQLERQLIQLALQL